MSSTILRPISKLSRGSRSKVTARVAAQLPSISDFDLTQFGPRTDGVPEGCLMVADRLELVRSSLIGVLSVGLLPSVDVDRPFL